MTNDARLVRSLRSRVQKPKMSLTFLIFFGGGYGGSRQKMERNFLVLLRRFRLQNELVLFYHLSSYLVAHFSVLAAIRGASSRYLMVILNSVDFCGDGNSKNGDIIRRREFLPETNYLGSFKPCLIFSHPLLLFLFSVFRVIHHVNVSFM